MFLKRSLFSILTLAVMGLVGCSGQDPVSPLAGFQPEISNAQDAFQLQATALDGVSGVVSYPWQNSGSQATINHSSAVDSGAVTVTIYDDSGAQVYGNPLVASLNEQTTTGQPGRWIIVVEMTDVYGSLNFRADAFTPAQ
ncbi:MAG TPA: hypothetical protein VLB27_11465 [candidate division Zixibacteria bacterium]|nr:hypothetical protein [candidate division Zixibacteria bacterium]